MKNITAIGEILYDIYPDEKRLGGAPFNFIYHVWKITAKANFVSSVGNDENGKEILVYLNSIGFNTNYISVDDKHPTGTVQVRIRDDKTPQFTISPECSYDFFTLNEKTKNLIDNETDIIYFGTLSQRSEPSRKTMEFVLNKNKKYFCDLNLRHDFYTKELIKQSLVASNVLKLNSDELEKLKSLFGLSPSTPMAIHELIYEFNIDILCVTLGADGAILSTKNEMSTYKTRNISPIDTLGAGDAYAAVLCLGYLNEMPIDEINKLANEFASEICMVNGALPKDDSIYEKYRMVFKSWRSLKSNIF
ncbi:MAG: carbohydrate kinase [Bacteroidetes bacterium]|nr:carbohydrate kinase [Bacteroidota bacterium]MCL6100659.1 carbohydrate kinase [Bacteroidota bacterium]